MNQDTPNHPAPQPTAAPQQPHYQPSQPQSYPPPYGYQEQYANTAPSSQGYSPPQPPPVYAQPPQTAPAPHSCHPQYHPHYQNVAGYPPPGAVPPWADYRNVPPPPQPPYWHPQYQQQSPPPPYQQQAMPPHAHDSMLNGLGSFFNFRDERFVKGAITGAALTFLLTNDSVQKNTIKSVVKFWSMVQGGIEEIKERFQDAEAEIKAEEQGQK